MLEFWGLEPACFRLLNFKSIKLFTLLQTIRKTRNEKQRINKRERERERLWVCVGNREGDSVCVCVIEREIENRERELYTLYCTSMVNMLLYC